jgi:hypothetical protein
MTKQCQKCGVELHEGPTFMDDERYGRGICGACDDPDLIERSGREGLSLTDRAGLLRHDLLIRPFNGITDATSAVTQVIHDLKLTVGAIRNTIALYEQAIERGQTDETLKKGARSFFSPIECQILAWRRGGHREWLRVRAEQRKRKL